MIVLLSGLSIKSFGSTTNGDFIKVINSYIDSYINNNSKLMNKILAEGATLKLSRGETLMIQPKESLVDFMNSSGKMVQNCEAKYDVLSKSGALVIARVDFDYANAIQHVYLILERNADEGWKITQVCKMIDDKEFIPTSKDLTSN
jgi:Putative lumazine-binding